MFETAITLAVGGIVGFTFAVVMAQSKFARVQARARELGDRLEETMRNYITERDLNEGLTQELADRTK
jgi:cysteine sulfinate desulfinase/cysteine desulfurase-like protein